MKKLIVAAAILLASFGTNAGVSPSASLTWDYDPADLALISGFRLYCDGQVVWQGLAQEVSFADAGMSRGPFSCYVTAFDETDESGPSNTVADKFYPGNPKNLHVK